MTSDEVAIPQDFPTTPSEWGWGALDSLCEGIYDCAHSTPELTAEGPYLIRTQNFPDGSLRFSDMARVSRETHLDRTRRATPRHGDVIYSREGSYHGIAAEIPDGVEACMGQRMVLIRPNVKALDFRFLRYWLNSNFVRSFIAGAKEGSGAPRINLPTIRRMAVPLPSLREQRAVGALLGALDDKIAVNERIAATAEDLMLTIASTVRWDRRIQLGEICSLRKEQCSPQELGVDIVDHYSLPAFDAKKVADRVSPASIKSNKFVIPGDAVLLSKLNPEIPRVWDAQPDQKILALASTEFLVLTPKSGLSTHQLWAVVAQQDFRSVLASRVTGTSKSHQRVRPAEALATEVVDPRQFGEEGQQIEGLAEKTALARKENRTLAALRDTLLPQLMSGRLRIRDTEKIVEDHA